MQEGQEYEYEFRALSADTDMIWMRNIVRPVHDAEGNVEDAALRDRGRDRAEAGGAGAGRRLTRGSATSRRPCSGPCCSCRPEDSFPGLAVKTLYEPASDDALVGGDFWDTFACDHGNVALVLGDVMGHGLPAAIFTAELKYSLRGFVREHEHPARILTQMNAYLCESHRLFAGRAERGRG